MNFFAFLKSLDDLLYEVVSWLVFYPVTLWRTARHPMAMTDYSTSELRKAPERQYDEALSPPILLLLTVIVAHGIELALIGDSKLIEETNGLAGLIDDDTSLILLRIVAFATFPLIFAVQTLRKQQAKLGRRQLEPAFFAQCYLNAPFALLISLAATLSQVQANWASGVALALLVPSLLGYLAVQTAWFHTMLGVRLGRALANALAAYLLSFVFMIALGWLVGGAW